MRSSKPMVAATFVAVGIFFGGALWREGVEAAGEIAAAPAS